MIILEIYLNRAIPQINAKSLIHAIDSATHKWQVIPGVGIKYQSNSMPIGLHITIPFSSISYFTERQRNPKS